MDPILETQISSNLEVQRPSQISEASIRDAISTSLMDSKLEELSTARASLRSNIFELWDRCAQASLTQYHRVSLDEVLKLRKVLAGSGYLPNGTKASTDEQIQSLKSEGIGSWINRVLSPIGRIFSIPRPEHGFSIQGGINALLKSDLKVARATMQQLRQLGEVELGFINKQIDLRTKLLGAIKRAEQSELFPIGTFEDLLTRVNQGIELREARRDVITNLTTPHLKDEARKLEILGKKLSNELVPLPQIFEEISEKLKEPPQLSDRQLTEIREEAVKLMEELLARNLGESANASETISEVIRSALAISRYLNRLKVSEKTLPLIELLTEYQKESLDSLARFSSEDIKLQASKFGSSATLLGWHPIINESLKEEPNLIEPEIDLPARGPRPNARKTNSATPTRNTEERLNQLGVLLVRFASLIVRLDSALLKMDDNQFLAYLRKAESLVDGIDSLDPDKILSSMRFEQNIKAITSEQIDSSVKSVRDLAATKGAFDNYRPIIYSNSKEMWRAFLIGLNQVHNHGIDINPMEVFTRIQKVKFPRGFPSDLVEQAIRRLTTVCSASTLDQIRRLPGNKLEVFHAERDTNPTYFVRINDLWRIGFRFYNSRAQEVALVNYH